MNSLRLTSCPSRLRGRFWLLPFVLATAQLPAGGTEKAPVPAEAVQAQKLVSLQSIYKDDYARRRPAERIALAKRLLTLSGQLGDDLPSLYVALSEARRLAASAGDTQEALDADGKLAAAFAVDAEASRKQVLKQLTQGRPAAEQARALAEAWVDLAHKELAAANFPAVAESIAAADAAAEGVNDAKYAAQLRQSTQAMRLQAAEYRRARPSLELLTREPGNPEANLAAGRFYCFSAELWDLGLPLLARGNDARLAAAATADRRVPPGAGAKELQGMGDRWWDIAATEPPACRAAIQARAGYWYARAVPGLKGLDLAKARERSKSSHGNRPVDLLALLESQPLAGRGGTWAVGDDGISVAGGGFSTLPIPYAVPTEYDFRIEFTRTSGSEGVLQIVSDGDASFFWIVGTVDNSACHFGDAINPDQPHPAPYIAPPILENGKRHVSVVHIRKDGVTADLDGKTLGKLTPADTSNYALRAAEWQVPPGTLGLGVNKSSFVFHAVEIVEVTGNGHVVGK